MVDYCSSHERFVARLTRGHSYQVLPALCFLAAGFSVRMPVLSVCGLYESPRSWRNSWDLEVEGYRIECKSRKLSFTNINDFPFDPVIVDEVDKWNDKHPKPLAYVFISQSTNAMFCLRGTSANNFGTVKKLDREMGKRCEYYTALKASFKPLSALVDWIAANTQREAA